MVGTLIRRPLPPVSDFIRTLLDDANAATALATLGIVSGTWTPTLFNTTNVAASTAYLSSYTRIGIDVYCWGRVDIDPTATTTQTTFGMSIPIASTFSSVDAGGVFNSQGIAGMSGAIAADTANNRVTFNYLAETAANGALFFLFGYRIS